MQDPSLKKILEVLELIKEPFGITYMDEFTEDTIKPKRSPLPSIEKERSNQID